MAHFPGFDIGSYPGDEAMAAWAEAGVYQWCGYYLTSPCHSDTVFVPFTGKAAFLQSLGLGLAIIYVGYQQSGCGSTLLTRAQGVLHGMDAIAKCMEEGFPRNVVIFLDIEYFSGPILPSFADYYQGWLSAVLDTQTFQPGTYCAKANYNDVYSAAQQEYGAHGLPFGGPVIWIALEDSAFDPVTADPTDSGIAEASLWQGLLDTQQSQGGVTLTVDLDTADSADPSQTRAIGRAIGVGYTFEEDIIEFED
jgi:hypothetical protein